MKRTGPETRADAFLGKSLSFQWLPVFLGRRLGRLSN
jgi:hypothetical protein